MNPVAKSFFIILFVLLVVVQKNAFCKDNDPAIKDKKPEQVIENYIAEYGKQPLIDVILDMRASQITIMNNGSFAEAFGRPRKDFVTVETILTDIDKAGLDITAFSERLEHYLVETHQKHERVKKTNTSDDSSIEMDTPPGKVSSISERNKILRKCKSGCTKEYIDCYEKITDSQDKCLDSGANRDHCNDIYEGRSKRCDSQRKTCTDKCIEQKKLSTPERRY